MGWQVGAYLMLHIAPLALPPAAWYLYHAMLLDSFCIIYSAFVWSLCRQFINSGFPRKIPSVRFSYEIKRFQIDMLTDY